MRLFGHGQTWHEHRSSPFLTSRRALDHVARALQDPIEYVGGRYHELWVRRTPAHSHAPRSDSLGEYENTKVVSSPLRGEVVVRVLHVYIHDDALSNTAGRSAAYRCNLSMGVGRVGHICQAQSLSQRHRRRYAATRTTLLVETRLLDTEGINEFCRLCCSVLAAAEPLVAPAFVPTRSHYLPTTFVLPGTINSPVTYFPV